MNPSARCCTVLSLGSSLYAVPHATYRSRTPLHGRPRLARGGHGAGALHAADTRAEGACAVWARGDRPDRPQPRVGRAAVRRGKARAAAGETKPAAERV